MAGVVTPQHGRVLVDGAEMGQLDLLTRRRVIGYLQQEPFLISGSLKENIAFGHPDASDADVLQAARLSGVDEFARLHPDGYSMRIDEGGRGLSQGQKQAVGLAQILLNDSRALLLDEPSSAFDMDAERRLVEALGSSLAQRTLVVVTHRPAFLQLVTRVVVIDDGRVVLDGPRDEILRRIAGEVSAPAR
ncbi:MAG: transporter family protein [Rhizobacter sp.]|nr:transporter family protein [Rhizobacter sp.]